MSFSTPYSKKIKHRLVDMFDARGYTNTKTITFEDDISALEADDGDEKVRLLFFEVLKFNVRDAELCMDIEDVGHLIIVYTGGMTCFARRIIDSCRKFTLEYFPSRELETNITKHVLQPLKFVRLEKDAADQFKRKWGDKFPKMLTADKIARYYHFVKDDVIEIHRRDGDVVYRIVSASPK